MPATAGRVRMPANNRVHSSAALQTHGIWQSAIGYDPYAPTNTRDKSKSGPDNSAANAYDSFQGLLALARVTSVSNPTETRGACKKCGRIGHLTFQCRNFLSLKVAEEDAVRPQQNYSNTPRIEKKAEEESDGEEDEDDDESLSSDSDSSIDPEIEKIIAERFGKKMSGKARYLSERAKKGSNSSDGDGDKEEKRKQRKHRRRRHGHRHRRSRKDSDSDSDSDSDMDQKHRRRRRRRRENDSDSSGDRRTKKRWRHRERRSVLSSGSESTASSSDEDDDDRKARKYKKSSRRH